MSIIANPAPEKVIARTSECMRRLMEAGLTFDDLQKPIDQPFLRKKIVDLWRGVISTSVTQEERARRIMGRNFFGIEDAVKHYGINPSVQQMIDLDEVPFTDEVLESCKYTHVLVAVFPISILEIRDTVHSKSFDRKETWYSNRLFAMHRGSTRWCLIRKKLVDGSYGMVWNKQQLLLNGDEKTPSTQRLVYTVMGHFLANDEYLFKGCRARTSSTDSDGRFVDIGWDRFEKDGFSLGIATRCDSHGYGSVGISSFRKPVFRRFSVKAE